MNNMLMVVITTLLVGLVFVGITFIIVKKKQNSKYKKEIDDLDIKKNQLLSVQILSVLTSSLTLVISDNICTLNN